MKNYRYYKTGIGTIARGRKNINRGVYVYDVYSPYKGSWFCSFEASKSAIKLYSWEEIPYSEVVLELI